MRVTRFLQLADAIRRLVIYGAGAIIVACTAVMAATLFSGVLVRYFLGGSLPWASELPVILFPWLIMAGVTVAAARNEHLGVDYLARKLPGNARRCLDISVIALITALTLGLAAQVPGILQFLQYQTTPVLGWSATYAFYSVPCGLVAVALVTLLRVPEVLFREVSEPDRPSGDTL